MKNQKHKSKINFDRGFERILITISLPTTIISFILIIREIIHCSQFINNKWVIYPTFNIKTPIIILILSALIWILFFVIKWIIKGFKQTEKIKK